MKTNLHKAFRVDRDAAENGSWRKIAPGVEMLLASSESRRYRSALRDAFKADADIDVVVVEAMAAGLILDWKGLTDEDGNEVPFSVETAKQLLSDPDLYLLKDRIALESANLANYRNEEIQDAAKN